MGITVVGKCPRHCNHPKYCVWEDWGGWTACTATCGNGGKKRRRRYLHLSEHGQARIDNLPDHVKDVMNTYTALQDKVKALRATHLSDVLISFFAGCFTLAAALVVARIFSGSRSRGQRYPM